MPFLGDCQLAEIYDALDPVASWHTDTAAGLDALRRRIGDIQANRDAHFDCPKAIAASLRDPWVELREHPGGWRTILHFPDPETAHLELWAFDNEPREATAVLEAMRATGNPVLIAIVDGQPADRDPEVVIVRL